MEVKSGVMWTAEMGVPQDLPPDEMMEQSRRQMELTQRTKTELDSRRLLWATTHALVGPIGDGYGLLARGRAGDASGELAEGEHLIRVAVGGYLDAGPVVEVDGESVELLALVGGSAGLWVVSEGYHEGREKTLLWVQTVDF